MSASTPKPLSILISASHSLISIGNYPQICKIGGKTLAPSSLLENVSLQTYLNPCDAATFPLY